MLNALRQIVEKRSGSGSITSGILTAESRHQIVELEGMLQKEKVEFEVRPSIHVLLLDDPGIIV